MPGTTTNGLPYPLPTEQAAGGAAAIQSLAQAVDARGGATLVKRGKTTLAFNGGRAALPITGLTTLVGCVLTAEWGGTGPGVPVVMAVETGQSTNTNIAVMAFRPSIPGTTDATWHTGNVVVHYVAWGT